MTGLGRFISSEGFFPIGESFSWRSDLLWTLLFSNLFLGLVFWIFAGAAVLISYRTRARRTGLNFVFPILLALTGLTHWVYAALLWEPLFWLSGLLKMITASVGALALIRLVEIWPQIIDIAQLARKVDHFHSRIERRFRKSLLSNVDFERLLKRSVFLPGLLMFILIIVFTSQITSIMNVKGRVETATKQISQMHALLRHFVDAESAFRGYLLSGDPALLAPLEDSKSRMPRLINDLLQKTAETPEIHDELARIGNNYIEWIRLSRPLIQARSKGSRAVAPRTAQRLRHLMEDSRQVFAEAIKEMVHRRDQYSQSAEQSAHLFILISVSLSIVIGASLAIWARRQILSLSASYARALANSRELNTTLEERVQDRTEALHQANRALATANQELEAFSYSVSHDLRGPLRGIDGFSQILVEDYSDRLDPQGLQYLTYIRHGVARMGNLIDDLLHLSKLVKMDLRKEQVDVSALAIQILQHAKLITSPRLQFEVDPHLLVEADPRLLRILLENLLGNAIKFTSRTEEPRIQVRGIQKNGFRGFVIEDNGAGFDMSYQNKLFLPFYRLHSEKDFEGTGIGLALCKRIVDRHEGEILAEGIPGEGARFRVFFPEIGPEARPHSSVL